MNLFAWAGLLTALSSLAMAWIVYFSNPHSRPGRLWAIFCLALAVWGGGALVVSLMPDRERTSLHIWRVAHAGVILIPPLFYHFTVAYSRSRHPAILRVAYALAGLFLLTNATPWLVAGTRLLFGQFWYSQAGPVYPLFVLYFLGVTGLGLLELWKGLRRSQEARQRQLTSWLLMGTGVGFLIGATCFLPVFGINLYPYGAFAVPLFPVIMTYAFLRHQLLDLKVLLPRAAMFLVLNVVAIGAPFVIGARYQAVWQQWFGEAWWMAPLGLMGVLASMSPAIFLHVTRRSEQSLWQAQRRYHRTLLAASSGMTRIKEIKRLCRLIVHMVNRTIQLTHSGLFLYDAQEQRYLLQASRSRSLMPAQMAVEPADPLITVLHERRDLVVAQELAAELKSGHGHSGSHSGAPSVYAWMRKLEASVIVPSFSEDKLLAFLVLGSKRSGEPFTSDDVAMFSALTNQGALAIENALFFEELRTNEAYMIQSEKLASLGQLASGMAHEIHNPLTIISGEAQLYLEQFRGKDQQADRVMKSVIEECQRASDITRRILRFAKPAPPDMNPVDMKAVAEESVTLAGYQVRLDLVEHTVTIPPNLPRVRGNYNQIQEIVLNLILNACQAMGEKGGKLQLRASAGNGAVELQVEDTGPGIPRAKLRKVFDPFYTTKSTGTGLGLFVSQRIVKLHGGSIEVASEEGQGTCFTVRLPVWKEEDAAPKAQAAA